MEESVTVGVAQGYLRGKKTVTASGTTYYSFNGIPYGKPPLGYLRFRVST
jgi:carboxylesterase type B